MRKNETIPNLTLTVVSGGSIDEEELFQAILRLRNELDNSDAVGIDLARESFGSHQGRKPADPITVGAIVLAISVAGIPNLLLIIQNWLLRQRDQTIRVKIDEIEVEVPRDIKQFEIDRIVAAIETYSSEKGD